MADFTALKTAIQNAIKQNGNEEITGNLLQDVLLAIVTTLGDGSINDLITALSSEATTRGNADTTLQQNIDAEAQARQLADSTLQGGINTVSAAITAINNAIGNGCVYAGIATPSSTPASGKVFYLALTAGTYTNYGGLEVPQGINILKNNGSTWLLDSIWGIDDAPTPSSNKLVKSGGVFNDIMTNGSAFDLSAYNNGTTYADLSAALTALNALPAAFKKGGMSVKFVQSSTNEYEQYKLTANTFTTDVTYWQNEDIFKDINDATKKLGELIPIDKKNARFVRNTGVIKNVGAGTFEVDIYDISNFAGQQIGLKTDIVNGGFATIFAFLTENTVWVNDQVIPYAGNTITDDLPTERPNILYVDVPDTAKYMAVMHKWTYDSSVYYIKTHIIVKNEWIDKFNSSIINLETAQKKKNQTTIVYTGGSTILYDRSSNEITFPANCSIFHEGVGYPFGSAITINLTTNNGFIVFNKNNVSTNNGVKAVNVNYKFANDDVILGVYSTVFHNIYLPVFFDYTNVYIREYSDSLVGFRLKLEGAKTTGRASGSTTPLQLLWFSDLHADTYTLNWMRQWISWNYIDSLLDDIISSGDQVQQYFTDDFAWWAANGASGYLMAVGNHECRDSQTQLDTYTAAQVYEKFFAPYISNWNVQSAGEGLCYYYKDYNANKIRLIVLDCMHWDSAQNSWLVSTLAAAKTNNLSVIVVNHFRADEPDYIQNPFTSLSTGDGSTLNHEVCAAVQDFIDGGGQFICHLAGHTHYDVVYTCHNYPDQLGIIIGCATRGGADDEHQNRSGRFACLFNCISFDIDKKLIKVLRPSCNMDRWCRAQNTLVVNYETRQVLYND